jgi:hypothetical protein
MKEKTKFAKFVDKSYFWLRGITAEIKRKDFAKTGTKLRLKLNNFH